MKRLISAALALTLLGATAASAAPVRGSFAPVDYRDHYRDHDNGNGAAVAAGIGFLALAAILASQNHDRDEWRDRDRDAWRDRDRDWRDRGYGNRGYGYGYAQPYGGYRGW